MTDEPIFPAPTPFLQPTALTPVVPQTSIKVTSTNIPGIQIGDHVAFGVGADGTLGVHRWPGGKTPWADPWPVAHAIEAGIWTTRSDVTVEYVRKTPTWAIVLGIIGLVTTIIGVLFLLVKTNVPVNRSATTLTATNGAMLVGISPL